MMIWGKRMERGVLLALVLALPLAGGCDTGGKVSVNLHGVNYTDKGFRYTVTDPSNPANSGGGELIGAYSAGGIMCCYALPKRWKPGIRVDIKATHRSEPDANNPYGEPIHENVTVEVPRYATGKPGDLWVIRHADGSMGVISSDYQPDHEKWPGEPKGWPEPSLEFQRKLWDQHIEIAEDDIRTATELLKRDEEDIELSAQKAWAVDSRYGADSFEIKKKYSGPTDPRYRNWMKEGHRQYLERSLEKLKRLREERP